MRLDVRHRLHEIIAEAIDAVGKFAGQLFAGGGGGQFRARMDQVGDGFGLGEIDAAVEKCATREFAGSGEAGAIFEDGVQDEFGGEHAAVAGDLDDVFAGECARGAQDTEEDFIDDAAGADDFAEMNCVRRGERRARARFPDGMEARVRDGEGLLAGEAHHGDASFAQWRGDGRDGVGVQGGVIVVRGRHGLFGSFFDEDNGANRRLFPLAIDGQGCPIS